MGAHGIEVAVAHDGEHVAAARPGLDARRFHALHDDLPAAMTLALVVPAREALVDDLPEATEFRLPSV